MVRIGLCSWLAVQDQELWWEGAQTVVTVILHLGRHSLSGVAWGPWAGTKPNWEADRHPLQGMLSPWGLRTFFCLANGNTRQNSHNCFKIYLIIVVYCFTMLCSFCCIMVWISHVCIHVPFPLEPPSHHPPHPAPLGYHRAPSWTPGAIHTSFVWHMVVCACQCYSPSLSHPPLPCHPPPHHVQKPVLS